MNLHMYMCMYEYDLHMFVHLYDKEYLEIIKKILAYYILVQKVCQFLKPWEWGMWGDETEEKNLISKLFLSRGQTTVTANFKDKPLH